MFLMLVVGCSSLINALIKNIASKSFMSTRVFIDQNLKKNILEEKNCKLVKKILIEETKERTLKFELREYVNDFQI